MWPKDNDVERRWKENEKVYGNFNRNDVCLLHFCSNFCGKTEGSSRSCARREESYRACEGGEEGQDQKSNRRGIKADEVEGIIVVKTKKGEEPYLIKDVEWKVYKGAKEVSSGDVVSITYFEKEGKKVAKKGPSKKAEKKKAAEPAAKPAAPAK